MAYIPKGPGGFKIFKNDYLGYNCISFHVFFQRTITDIIVNFWIDFRKVYHCHNNESSIDFFPKGINAKTVAQ